MRSPRFWRVWFWVTAAHLSRLAYLYVRQSTLRQVFENTESTHRQYALRERAVALGWPLDRIIVIDSDLGQSGASAADREGFQRLVTEVSLSRVGIVLGLEVSRLARNSTDWHRLLELCALADTLILDEDGLYDPAHFNDRLLLGLALDNDASNGVPLESGGTYIANEKVVPAKSFRNDPGHRSDHRRKVAGLKSESVAGFISEWWPGSFRNRGRLAPESAAG